MDLIFVLLDKFENFLTTKISRITMILLKATNLRWDEVSAKLLVQVKMDLYKVQN